MSAQAAVGFRVKSGWATAVLLVGPARAPRVADRRASELSDPAAPTSRQPYDAVLVERQAYPAGATALHRAESQLKRAVTELGRAIDGPWRADEKTAALAAWMTLR